MQKTLIPWWKEEENLRNRHLFRWSNIPSTHSLAQQWLEGEKNHLLSHFPRHHLRSDTWIWVRSDTQTLGRGQGNHSFFSPPGGLYATLICLWPHLPTIPPLALITALSIAETLSDHCCLKWVNDIFLDQKKLGGILIDRHWSTPLMPCIISFGLNMNSQHTHTPEQRSITSWRRHSGSSWDLSDLFWRIEKQLQKRYTAIIQQEGKLCSATCDAINTRLPEFGRSVLCTTPSGRVTGICRGINSWGRLIIHSETTSRAHDVLTLCISNKNGYNL